MRTSSTKQTRSGRCLYHLLICWVFFIRTAQKGARIIRFAALRGGVFRRFIVSFSLLPFCVGAKNNTVQIIQKEEEKKKKKRTQNKNTVTIWSTIDETTCGFVDTPPRLTYVCVQPLLCDITFRYLRHCRRCFCFFFLGFTGLDALQPPARSVPWYPLGVISS